MDITQNKLKELFTYDPEEPGALRWKKQLSGRGARGDVAGFFKSGMSTKGSRVVVIGKKTYLISRLVWLWHNGELPSGRLQFIDGNRKDCRITNLRNKKTLNERKTDRNFAKRQALSGERGLEAQTKQRRLSLNNHLKFNFGISIEEYEALNEKQNGLCAICNFPERHRTHPRLSVDHCHKTNKIRGLLCSRCNTAIGQFKDSVDIIQSAVNYLKKHS